MKIQMFPEYDVTLLYASGRLADYFDFCAPLVATRMPMAVYLSAKSKVRK
jgi:hypothetical protein